MKIEADTRLKDHPPSTYELASVDSDLDNLLIKYKKQKKGKNTVYEFPIRRIPLLFRLLTDLGLEIEPVAYRVYRCANFILIATDRHLTIKVIE